MSTTGNGTTGKAVVKDGVIFGMAATEVAANIEALQAAQAAETTLDGATCHETTAEALRLWTQRGADRRRIYVDTDGVVRARLGPPERLFELGAEALDRKPAEALDHDFVLDVAAQTEKMISGAKFVIQRATIDELARHVKSEVSETDLALVLRRLARLALPDSPAIAFVFDLLADEPPETAGYQGERVSKLAASERLSMTDRILCAVAATALRWWTPAALAEADAADPDHVTCPPENPGAAAVLEGKSLRLGQRVASLTLGQYANGQLAVLVVEASGDEVTLTMPMPDAPPLEDGELYVNATGENEALARAALRSELFEDTGRTVPVGYGYASIWRVGRPRAGDPKEA